MESRELDTFLEAWEAQARGVVRVLESLPPTQYDFHAAPGVRSIGEMAWHLAELDAYISFGIERGALSFAERPPGIERPKEVAALAKGYERVHAEARVRLLQLQGSDLGRSIPSFDGKPAAIRELLWSALLHHSIHHLAQLVLMCRMAGGTPPGIYGPNLEQTAAMKTAAAAR